jgi:integrase
MGSIVARRRKDGSVGYTAQIKVKRGGKIVHSEAATFEREPSAKAWIEKREKALASPGGLEAAKREKGVVKDLIDRYVKAFRKDIGRTKEQCLNTLKGFAIAEKNAEDLTSADIVELARELSDGRKPQTVQNYLSHFSAVLRVGRVAWGLQISRSIMKDALEATKHFGLTAKSEKRDRRPSLDELNRLMEHFAEKVKSRRSMPMHRVMAFAIYSTRREEEITRLRWDDLEEGRVLVRDMKHPGDKIGNDTWCVLVPEAEAIARAMPQVSDRIFPYSADAISAAFTRAKKFLSIENLTFHDLRHEGTSRLLEMGWQIQHVAEVTGHRSWVTLQRYAHLRQTGDKLAGWEWLPRVTNP